MKLINNTQLIKKIISKGGNGDETQASPFVIIRVAMLIWKFGLKFDVQCHGAMHKKVVGGMIVIQWLISFI